MIERVKKAWAREAKRIDRSTVMRNGFSYAIMLEDEFVASRAPSIMADLDRGVAYDRAVVHFAYRHWADETARILTEWFDVMYDGKPIDAICIKVTRF